LAPCEIVPVIDDEELEKVNLSGYLFFIFFFAYLARLSQWIPTPGARYYYSYYFSFVVCRAYIDRMGGRSISFYFSIV
jgi:hypothetical protein